jgi:hypothetical protein
MAKRQAVSASKNRRKKQSAPASNVHAPVDTGQTPASDGLALEGVCPDPGSALWRFTDGLVRQRDTLFKLLDSDDRLSGDSPIDKARASWFANPRGWQPPSHVGSKRRELEAEFHSLLKAAIDEARDGASIAAPAIHTAADAHRKLIDAVVAASNRDRSGELVGNALARHGDAIESLMMYIPPLKSKKTEIPNADIPRLFPGGVPDDPDLVDLVVAIDAEKRLPELERRSGNEIARNLMRGDETKSESLLRKLRRKVESGLIAPVL